MKKRIIRLIFSFLIIYTLNFFIPRMIPGDPFSHSSVNSGDEMGGLSKEDIIELKKYYGLDKPLPEQFIMTIKENSKGNLGNSPLYKKPVKDILIERMPWTIYLMWTSLIISLVLGTILSIISIKNIKLGSIIHRIMMLICEVPPFVLGVILLFLGPAKFSWLPLSGALTPFKQYSGYMDYFFDVFLHSITPITTLVIINVPGFYFISKISLEETIKKSYVHAAKTRGLSNNLIIIKYIFLNSWTPIISKFFLSIGNVLGATIIVENVFAYPGIGQTMRDAIINRDFILIQGIFLVSTIIVLISSFISDMLVHIMANYE